MFPFFEHSSSTTKYCSNVGETIRICNIASNKVVRLKKNLNEFIYRSFAHLLP